MNSTGGASVADIRAHLAVLAGELKTLHSSVFQCPTGELGEFLGELAELRALAGAATAVVTADAETRGLIDASQAASTRGWVSEYGWHSRREAATIAKAAHILRRPDLAEVADSIRTADLDLPTAVVVQGEYDKLAPDLLPGAHQIVLEHMVNHGAEHAPAVSGRCGSTSWPATANRTSSPTSRTPAADTSLCPTPPRPPRV